MGGGSIPVRGLTVIRKSGRSGSTDESRIRINAVTD
jgi:hypothetical protein